jgi:hypothetical protein
MIRRALIVGGIAALLTTAGVWANCYNCEWRLTCDTQDNCYLTERCIDGNCCHGGATGCSVDNTGTCNLGGSICIWAGLGSVQPPLVERLLRGQSTRSTAC